MNIKFKFCCCILTLMFIGSTFSKRGRRPHSCKHIGRERGSFLWEIKGDPPSYFFGTIHVPYTRVWGHVPENAKRAFYMSDDVFFELDLTNPTTISSLSSCQLLPKGQNLSTILPEDLYQRLTNHLSYVQSQITSWITDDQKGRGFYAEYLFNAITGNWQRKRPVWVMLMVNSLTKADIRSRGVPVLDLFLAQEAERHKKPIGAVERVDEQCVPLNTLNYSQSVFALDHTLSQQESIREGTSVAPHSTDTLITHYNCGNIDTILLSQDSAQASSLSVPQLKNESLPALEAIAARELDNYFKKELIVRRNERMAQRVSKILRSKPNRSIFFAFGAGHFLGNNTVIDIVRRHGFQIEHVPFNYKIKWRKKKRRSKGGFVPRTSILKNFSLSSKDLRPGDQIDPAFAKFLSENKNVFIRYQKPASTLAPKSNFNDLWVRINDGDRPRSNDEDDDKKMEESLRVWYGLPSSSTSEVQGTKLIMTSLLLFLVMQ